MDRKDTFKEGEIKREIKVQPRGGGEMKRKLKPHEIRSHERIQMIAFVQMSPHLYWLHEIIIRSQVHCCLNSEIYIKKTTKEEEEQKLQLSLRNSLQAVLKHKVGPTLRNKGRDGLFRTLGRDTMLHILLYEIMPPDLPPLP